jgi:hypothetical protein
MLDYCTSFILLHVFLKSPPGDSVQELLLPIYLSVRNSTTTDKCLRGPVTVMLFQVLDNLLECLSLI